MSFGRCVDPAQQWPVPPQGTLEVPHLVTHLFLFPFSLENKREVTRLWEARHG